MTPGRVWRMLGGAIVLTLVVLLTGCGESRPGTQLFAVADVDYAHGDFEGSALLRIDPSTLQPLRPRGLRLGDAVTTRAFSPAGDQVAFGGYNFGEIVFVDLPPRRAMRMTVAPRYSRVGGIEVDVEGWPLRSRLIAVATVTGAWSAPHPSQLLVIDPGRRRVLRRTPLRGNVVSSVSAGNAPTALLVIRGRIPRLVVVRPDGSTWSRSLRRLGLAGHDSVRIGGTYYRPIRVPALASDRLGRVFVVAADRPVAEIRLANREVRYHSVALPRRYLSYPPPTTPGSGGVHLRFSTSVTLLGKGKAAIGGSDERPGWIRGFGAGHRSADRVLEIVDTHRWRRRREIHASTCQRAGTVTLCRATASGFPPDGKGIRGPSLVAYDARWHRLYEKRSPRLWWELTAGRLLVGSLDGRRVSELDLQTGRAIRQITPSPLTNQMWPLDLFAWTPPH